MVVTSRLPRTTISTTETSHALTALRFGDLSMASTATLTMRKISTDSTNSCIAHEPRKRSAPPLLTPQVMGLRNSAVANRSASLRREDKAHDTPSAALTFDNARERANDAECDDAHRIGFSALV
jgi:hypothetical protein